MSFAVGVFAAVCAFAGCAFPLALRWYTARSKKRIAEEQRRAVDQRIVP